MSKTNKEKIEVQQAFEDGKTIKIKRNVVGIWDTWRDTVPLNWNCLAGAKWQKEQED